ncbi:MAG: PfkB family carbohydrate kinase [Phycisphaerales bacterium]
MTPPPGPAPGKILSRAELLTRRAAARAAGRRVVHCHGCFDLVHPGHIRHLRYARALGDILLVTLTGDAQVSKGAGRPLIPEELRAENLAALDCVDWVSIEPRPTAEALLTEVRPDVYVKGREYEFNQDPRFKAEREAVESGGGRVVFSSGDVVFSSTALINALESSVDPFQARLEQLLGLPDLQGASLFSLISAFRGRRVLVVGETILDTYILCDRPEVAGESPVMTLRPIEKRHYDGGAAILARHLAAMGARPTLITALPETEQGEAIRSRLTGEGIEVRPLRVPSPICEKQRFLVGAQKVMKLDLIEPLTLDAAQQDDLVDLAAAAAEEGGGSQAAIVADFGQGLFSQAVLPRICRALRRRVGTLTGDVSGRRSNLRSMYAMDLLCPSESELRQSLGLFDRGLPTVTWQLLEETKTRAAIVTLGPEGMIAFDREAPGSSGTGVPPVGTTRDSDTDSSGSYRSRVHAEHIPALTPYAIDALGCGDSLLAAATLALSAGAPLVAAAFLGATAAAIQAQRIGNIPISATDLRQAIARTHSAHMTFAAAEVVSARESPRAAAQIA